MVESSVRSSKKYPFGGIVPRRRIWISPPSDRVHPLRLIGELEVLKSSIHSSFADARVPDQANSFIKTDRGGKGVEAGEGVGLMLGVSEGVVEGVDVRLGVSEGVGEGVFEGDAVGDWVLVGVLVGDGEGVDVDVGVSVAASVGVASFVGLGEGVGV